MKIIETPFPGVKIIQSDTFKDERGLNEFMNIEDFQAAGLPINFPQVNTTQSYANVLRGMHVQKSNPQGKLVKCVAGTIQDCWIDLRRDSPMFKRWGTYQLSMAEPEALYLPPGMAHGFLTLTNFSVVQYHCTTLYDKESNGGVKWNDPKIGILWEMEDGVWPTLSAKDAALPSVDEYLESLS